MKTYRILLPLLALSLTLSAKADTITLANGDWAPYLGESLPNGGPVAHLVSEAFATQGWTVRYEYLPWKRGYNMAEAGELDGSIVWSRNAEREAVMNYSDPVVQLDTVVFYADDRPVDWSEPDDLKGLRLGGVIGYDYGFVKPDDGYNVSYIGEPVNNYRKLMADRLDAVMEERLVGLNLAKESGVADQVSYHPKTIKSKPYFLIVGKANPKSEEILRVFNLGLQELKDNGSYDSILGVN
ncbi:substrate-binding periplasmic protein [Saccharospirillum salsuginis]|uniref:Amino acid ABC transporter substrate-binding protein n=1 Tax=Saccharospirillum salsuginis TaxID=418750 RepID=A0A918NGT4_9GAMM|nr:transporter substrate-binding domain-containing protein [Saccharospirillum salsuginis]GGX66013.1 amino acid ABC transporter substrate-binding protein [Saccharospirillum salsuginis]